MNAPAFARSGSLLARAGVVQAAAPAPLIEPVATTPAPLVVDLPRDAFASTWPHRPEVSAKVGLRLVGLKTTELARAEAARIAWEMHPEEGDGPARVDCFNEALLRGMLAKATCHAEDLATPLWDCAEENIKLALVDTGLRVLWDAYRRLELELDQLTPPAPDADLERLAVALRSADAWARLPASEAVRVRRLLAHALKQLGG